MDWKKLGIIARDIFITTKCLVLIFKSTQVSIRYYKTYDTILQFEIWFLALSAFKITSMLPNMLLIMNINYLFTMLVLNELMLIISNHHLHVKTMKAMYYYEVDHTKLSYLLATRLILLFIIVMWAIYPNLGLECSQSNPYPNQLAALMFLDFANALVDLVITLFLPRRLNRIIEARERAGSILSSFDESQMLNQERSKPSL